MVLGILEAETSGTAAWPGAGIGPGDYRTSLTIAPEIPWLGITQTRTFQRKRRTRGRVSMGAAATRHHGHVPSQRDAVKTCAWIWPDTGPGPNCRPISAATASVIWSSAPGARASSSLRKGVP